MLAKRYLLQFCLAVVVLAVAVVTLNRFVDPFQLFGTPAAIMAGQPNMRHFKAEYIVHNCGKYDSYVFGNSRSAVFQLTGQSGAYYNYSVPDDRANGILDKLRLLLSRGCAIKSAVIGLSVDLIGPVDWAAEGNLLRGEPPRVSGESQWRFWTRYLFSRGAVEASLTTLFYKDQRRFEYQENGAFRYLWKIDRDDLRTCARRILVPDESIVARDLLVHKQIKRLADEHGIAVSVVVTPMLEPEWSNYLADRRVKNYLAALQRIYDRVVLLEQLPGRALQPQMWHDCQHFRWEAFRDEIVAGLEG